MPLIARQRSRLAVLAVLALVGSLLAVSAVPVAADDGKADKEAKYSACVGAAAEDAEFTDMDGSFAEDAANCLAHYRITKGTSEGVFSPNASVTRLQMALFLSRAAGPAGIVLPSASDQGFGDIGGMSDEIQDAINQIAELDIMAGRSDNEFDPVGMVTRVDMAVHLAAFLSEAVVGPGGEDIDGKDFTSDDTGFEDLGSVTFAAYGAINDLFELGVTTGTTDTTFSPAALVSRGQMAAFITRALAHTNARPAGLSVQTEKTAVFKDTPVEFDASVRDVNHRPLADVSVDFFYAGGDDLDEPFTDEGACSSGVKQSTEGTTECVIDSGDLTTGSDGNLSAKPSVVADNNDTTVWAWMGDLGDAFDADETDSVMIDISAAEKATAIEVTYSSATTVVKFGETVTFTLQLIDTEGDPVAEEGIEVLVKAEIKVDSGSVESSRTDTLKTDASGRIQQSYTEDDPDDDDDVDNMATVIFSASRSDEPKTVVDGEGKNFEPETITWSDADGAPKTLKLESSRSYAEASDDGSGASNTVRATLTDQYGDPVGKKPVDFTSKDTVTVKDKDGKDVSVGPPNVTRHTSSSRGVASFSYQRDSEAAGTQTVGASYTGPEGKVKVALVELDFYWVTDASKPDGSVLAADTANNAIVVGTKKAPALVEYDSNDHFSVDGDAVIMSEFEKALDDDTRTTNKLSGTLAGDSAGVSTFKLTK